MHRKINETYCFSKRHEVVRDWVEFDILCLVFPMPRLPFGASNNIQTVASFFEWPQCEDQRFFKTSNPLVQKTSNMHLQVSGFET